eukprot:TRINITY_DN788_c0_g2_i1.p1 TRINITY_DN788_c0_g2~~TRINITY_DN788_c0_g2_i1.p1  ORF type:complete len:628 (+),score=114.12 TRINITY_DN788_c0_g2_i1:110-1885(+)
MSVTMLSMVDKLNTTGSGKSRRVLASTAGMVFLCDDKGAVHRAVPWTGIEEVVTQGDGAGSQLLLRLRDESDVVVAWVADKRNTHPSTAESIEAMKAAAERQGVTFRTEAGDGGLRGLARHQGRQKVAPAVALANLSKRGLDDSPQSSPQAPPMPPPPDPEPVPEPDPEPEPEPEPSRDVHDPPGPDPQPADPSPEPVPPPADPPSPVPAHPAPSALEAPDPPADDEQLPMIVVSGPDAADHGAEGEYLAAGEPGKGGDGGRVWDQRDGPHRIEERDDEQEGGMPVWLLRKDDGPPLFRTVVQPGRSAAANDWQRRGPDGTWLPARIGVVMLPQPTGVPRTPPTEGLPPSNLWEVYSSRTRPGKVYYYNPATDESRWELPDGWRPPQPAPGAPPRYRLRHADPVATGSPTTSPRGRKSKPWSAFVKEFERGRAVDELDDDLPPPPQAAGTDAAAIESVARYEVCRRHAEVVSSAARTAPDWGSMSWADRLACVRAYEAACADHGSPPVFTGPRRPVPSSPRRAGNSSPPFVPPPQAGRGSGLSPHPASQRGVSPRRSPTSSPRRSPGAVSPHVARGGPLSQRPSAPVFESG